MTRLPAPGLRLIEVRTTDRYGHKSAARRIIQIHEEEGRVAGR